MAHSKNWILLRGLARGTGHWGGFAEKMRERFPEDKFELLDLPGNGARNEETSPLKISEYVKDLRSRSKFVRSGEPFQFLAVSLGAMIAVEWMHEYPHEVRKAYLACTSSSNYSPFYNRFKLKNYGPSLSLMFRKKDPAVIEKTILKMIVNSQERREAAFLPLVEYSKKYPLNFKNVIRQLIAASQYSFPTQAPGDVKLIGSFGDQLVSSTCTLEIAKAWDLKPVMHPWSGHDIPIDDPQWLLEHLL